MPQILITVQHLIVGHCGPSLIRSNAFWVHRHDLLGEMLSDIGSLLPYHSHVDPKVVVGALNHMIDDVSSGTTVFYDFYTEAQKRAEPTREHTGLFFFRGRPGAPFAMIAPARRWRQGGGHRARTNKLTKSGLRLSRYYCTRTH